MDALIEELAERLTPYIDDAELVRDKNRDLDLWAESLHGVVMGDDDIRKILENLSPVSGGQQSGVREALRLLRAKAIERFAVAEQRLTLASAC